MSVFNPYSKISQYRNFLRENRLDGDVAIQGTVKLHGTNAAFHFSKEHGLRYQSRSQFIQTNNDNAGFVSCFSPLENELVGWLSSKLGDSETIVVYGEWAGKGIQKGTGINQIPKTFFIIDVKKDGIPLNWEELVGFGNNQILGIYNIASDFPVFHLSVDTNNPDQITETLSKLTLEVENQCPVAEKFGFTGIGEGIVWSNTERTAKFKVKGSKHSVTKTKKIVTIAPETLATIQDFVEYAATTQRFEQGLVETQNTERDIKKLGMFIGWVNKDIHSEESDTLEESGLTMKDVGRFINDKARKWFLEQN